MDEVMYCEKCGFVGHILFSKRCKNCKTKMKVLPEDIKYKYHIFVEDWSNCSDEEIIQREENFVMGELQTTPLFSIEEYNKQVKKQIELNQRLTEWHRKKLLEQQSKNIAIMLKDEEKRNISVSCPYCKSNNTSKITITNKAVHTAIFGMWSMGRNTKQWHCNNCNSDF